MVLVTGAPLLHSSRAHAFGEHALTEPVASDAVVLEVSGVGGAHFVAVARELLGRIHIRVQTRDEHVGSAEPALLDVSVRIAGNGGGFVARRPADGRVVASAEMSFETEELLREALAHSLLSLVDAVKQGQPVPGELQQTDPDAATEPTAVEPSLDRNGAAPHSAAPPPSPSLAIKLETSASLQQSQSDSGVSWRVTVAAAGGLLDSSHPGFGGLVRVERRVTEDWALGAALGYAATRRFSVQGYRVAMSRSGLRVHGVWRLVELASPKTSLLLVPALGINGESAEASSGDGELGGRQTKWLPTLGASGRLRHDVGAVSLEAEFGVHAFPRAPRLVVADGDHERSLFEPWSVQPELTLGVGVLF